MRNKLYMLLSLLFLTSLSAISAQQLYLETGGNTSTFDFTPTSLNKSFSKPFTSRMAGGVLWPIAVKNLNLYTGVAYDMHAIESTYSNNQIPISFDLEYFSTQLGLQYALFRVNDFTFQLNGGLSYNWLMYGRQVEQSMVVDLTNAKNTKTEGLNYQLGLGIEYPISKSVAVYARYGLNNSLKAFTDKYENKMTIDSRSVNVGVRIKLPSRSEKICDDAEVTESIPYQDVVDDEEKLVEDNDSINDVLEDMLKRIEALEKSCQKKDEQIDKLLAALKNEGDQNLLVLHDTLFVKGASEEQRADSEEINTQNHDVNSQNNQVEDNNEEQDVPVDTNYTNSNDTVVQQPNANKEIQTIHHNPEDVVGQIARGELVPEDGMDKQKSADSDPIETGQKNNINDGQVGNLAGNIDQANDHHQSGEAFDLKKEDEKVHKSISVQEDASTNNSDEIDDSDIKQAGDSEKMQPTSEKHSPETRLDNQRDESTPKVVGLKNKGTYATFFDFDSDVIHVSDFEMLNEIAQSLKSNSRLKISILGYADKTGDEHYNYYLSERRAKRIKDFLLEYGVLDAQCEIMIKGETDEFGQVRSLNRRCVLSIE